MNSYIVTFIVKDTHKLPVEFGIKRSCSGDSIEIVEKTIKEELESKFFCYQEENGSLSCLKSECVICFTIEEA